MVFESMALGALLYWKWGDYMIYDFGRTGYVMWSKLCYSQKRENKTINATM